MSVRVRVLFVCLGNICRSPVAEGVFRQRVKARGLEHLVDVSSAGLGGWHAGERPDHRAIAAATRHGVPLESRARRIDPVEFGRTHWIVCMDHDNRRGLERIGAPSERVRLLKSFAPGAIGASDEVDDPYEHGDEAFDRMVREVTESMDHFIDHLVREHGLEEAHGGSESRATDGSTDSSRASAQGREDGREERRRGV